MKIEWPMREEKMITFTAKFLNKIMIKTTLKIQSKRFWFKKLKPVSVEDTQRPIPILRKDRDWLKLPLRHP
jgi:hypothetical protein